MVGTASCRRFNLLDAIVLVATTGAAVAVVRTDLPDLWAVLRTINVKDFADLAAVRAMLARPHSLHNRSIRSLAGDYVGSVIYRERRPMLLRSKGQIIAIADDLTVISLPFLVHWTLALVFLRVCRPRPAWSNLVWQPGLWACSTALITLLVLLWADWLLCPDLPPAIVPCSVVGAWSVLAATHGWSSERSWIDRAGRCLGLAWLALLPLYFVLRIWGF